VLHSAQCRLEGGFNGTKRYCNGNGAIALYSAQRNSAIAKEMSAQRSQWGSDAIAPDRIIAVKRQRGRSIATALYSTQRHSAIATELTLGAS
jgi:hypothetical protein